MRILIVEDDPSLASGLARILEAEGYAVDVTSRGEQAVEAARQEQFDLVILDIGLPGIDGFEALRRLRGAEYRVPVLVLTARDTVSDRVHGLDLGADDYMAKPFAMPELTARVRALIRRSQAQTGPCVTRGPVCACERRISASGRCSRCCWGGWRRSSRRRASSRRSRAGTRSSRPTRSRSTSRACARSSSAPASASAPCA